MKLEHKISFIFIIWLLPVLFWAGYYHTYGNYYAEEQSENVRYYLTILNKNIPAEKVYEISKLEGVVEAYKIYYRPEGVIFDFRQCLSVEKKTEIKWHDLDKQIFDILKAD